MKLAINGGKPVREKKMHAFPVVDKGDILSTMESFYDNSFSGFRAGTYEGGPRVKSFESTVKNSLGSDYAVAFDTWSNGIVASMMAIGLEPGDEVIITPYTMTSCATSILSCGAIPVFADVCEDSGCLDPADVRKKITNKTRAIFVVHLFGIPANMTEIMKIADEFDLFVFEDCAQSPMAKFENKFVGTIGDIGGFSFTESKHVMSGEGGIAITNNGKINNGLRVIRNHGEVLSTDFSEEKSYADQVYGSGLIGYNFRITEPIAALAESQWKKLEHIISNKVKMANFLMERLSQFPFIDTLQPKYEHSPAWYQLPLRYNENHTGVSREKFVSALNAEGLNFSQGYVCPLYYQSIYRSNKHWVLRNFAPEKDYSDCACPVVESLWRKKLIATLDIRSPYTMEDMQDIVNAFEKINNNINELT